MVPATFQTGVMIMMPDGKRYSGASQANNDEGEAKKSIVHGPDICVGVMVEVPRWLMGRRSI
jgi:hypothetical protein